MRTCVPSILLALVVAPSSTTAFTVRPTFSPRTNTNVVQPSGSAAPMKMVMNTDAFSSILLSVDDAIDTVSSAVDAAAPAAVEAISSAVDAAAPASAAVTEAAANNNGWFGFLAGPIESLLMLIHSGLGAVGIVENGWGISILGLTLLIKLLTYPLTASQLESTTKMQVLQPSVKAIQNTYQSNPEVMNQKIAELYQTEGVNPLAGCLPSLAQLPIFIGLYRSVLNLAKENALDEPFLWLPNLEGPVYGSDPAHGSDWIFKGWVDGVPSLGWEDTVAFGSIPVILIASQFLSQKLMQPKNQDPAQAQANAVLKFLPFLIGYFSLNVPAALGIYWVANNFITTAITLQIRSGLQDVPAAAAAGSTSTPTVPNPPAFTPAPARDRPSGFAAQMDADGVKPITPIDAEILDEETRVEDSVQASTPPSTGRKKKRGRKKKGNKK